MHPRNTVLLSQDVAPPQVGRISVAGYIRNSRGEPRNPMRVLGSYAIVYLIAGSGRYCDASGVDRAVAQQDLIVLLPELAHGYGPGPGEHWSEYYIVFDGPVFDAWRPVLREMSPVVSLPPVELWSQRIRSVVRDGSPRDMEQTLEQVWRMQQLLGEIAKHRWQSPLADDDRAFLKRARDLLEPMDAGDQPSAPAIAAELSMSYQTFRKRFARLAGASPGQYVQRRRMDRLAELLGDPSLKLREIARRGGFCDEFHFSRRFKQVVGISPREFRRRLAGQGRRQAL